MNKWASAVWGFIDKKMKPIAFDGAIGFVRSMLGTSIV
mgnify:CR=1 FL=1